MFRHTEKRPGAGSSGPGAVYSVASLMTWFHHLEKPRGAEASGSQGTPGIYIYIYMFVSVYIYILYIYTVFLYILYIYIYILYIYTVYIYICSLYILYRLYTYTHTHIYIHVYVYGNFGQYRPQCTRILAGCGNPPQRTPTKR